MVAPVIHNPNPPGTNEAILCMQTAVRNESGKTQTFDYLPPHGVTLLDGEEYLIDGNILDILGSGKPYRTKRKRDSFISDLQAGIIVILHTPVTHYYDDALQATKITKIHGGIVTVDDPCWGRYVSSHGPDEGAE